MAVRKVQETWWIDFGFKGQRYRLRSPDNHRDGAIRYEHVLRHKLSHGEKVYLSRDPRSRESAEQNQTFGAFASRWHETYSSADLKPSTRVSDERSLRLYLLPFFGHHAMRAITTGLIEDFRMRREEMGRRGISTKTMNNVLSVLRRILVEACDRNVIEKVPRIKWCKRSPGKFDCLTSEESLRLMSASGEEPWGLMVLCALRTGMRFGELLGLRWEDIDFLLNWIHIRCNVVNGIEGTPKNNRYRRAPLAPDLREALLRAPRRADRVMVLPGGETPLRWMAVRALRRACAAAGLRKIGWHALRHTFATQLLRAKVDVTIVQRLMGHSTLEMTLRYAHVGMDQMEEAMGQLFIAESKAAEVMRQFVVNQKAMVDINAPKTQSAPLNMWSAA